MAGPDPRRGLPLHAAAAGLGPAALLPPVSRLLTSHSGWRLGLGGKEFVARAGLLRVGGGILGDLGGMITVWMQISVRIQ